MLMKLPLEEPWRGDKIFRNNPDYISEYLDLISFPIGTYLNLVW